MPRLTIDGRSVEVPEGTTILRAARSLGIEVPTLCHLEDFAPDPSCFVCVVQVEGRREMSPACATVVADGMVVRTDTDDVRQSRRTALELLLSDHTGDCVAPCSLACPAHLDVADFVHRVTQGDYRGALEIVKQTLALPASLGRVCPRFCERVCRRKDLDEPVAICALHRFVADHDLASAEPFTPGRAAPSGKRVAIVGAGPAGLSAAYYLLQRGHVCTLLDARDQPGGMFRYGIPDWQLPSEVLDGEIDAVRRLGAELLMNTRLGEDVSLASLRRDYDAVLLAIGAQTKTGAVEEFHPGSYMTAGTIDTAFVASLGLETGPRGVKAGRATCATNLPGVFAAGGVASGPNYGVHAVAAGRRAAATIGQFLAREPVVGEPHHVNVVMRDLSENETARLVEGITTAPRVLRDAGENAAPRGLDESEAREEAERCLDCDCGKRRDCGLRRWSEAFDASPTRYRGERRPFDRDATHGEVVFESGKCIQCGRCVRIAEEAREELGLTFVGRGFSVKTAAPFSETLKAGLRRTAERCADACPTGALYFRRALRERLER